jgi:peptidoglycan/LPS O-acetylase OafA/YrhL
MHSGFDDNEDKYINNYLYCVDLIRFVSALLVVFFHLGYSVWANPTSGARQFIDSTYDYKELSHVFRHGWIGVEVFFVISGMVIYRSAKNASFLKFVSSRILRLYPATWICASITLVVTLLTVDMSGSELVRRYVGSMLLIPVHPWIDPVYWTLAVEISFYTIIGIVLLSGWRNIFYHVAFMLTVVCLGYQILQAFQHVSELHIIPELPLQVIRLSMMEYGSFFALGIIVGLKIQRGYLQLRDLAIAFMAIIACCISIYFNTIAVNSYLNNDSNMAFNLSVPLLVWVVSVLIFYFSESIDKFFGKYIPSSFVYVKILGRMTFPIYLIHFIPGVTLTNLLSVEFGFHKHVSLAFAVFSILVVSLVVSTRLEPLVKSWLAGCIAGMAERLRISKA